MTAAGERTDVTPFTDAGKVATGAATLPDLLHLTRLIAAGWLDGKTLYLYSSDRLGQLHSPILRIHICTPTSVLTLRPPSALTAKREQEQLLLRHNASEAGGSIGWNTFLALCQSRNVRIFVCFPIIGKRTVPIDTDKPGQWARLELEFTVVQNQSLNRAAMIKERKVQRKEAQKAKVVLSAAVLAQLQLLGPPPPACPPHPLEIVHRPGQGEWRVCEELALCAILDDPAWGKSVEYAVQKRSFPKWDDVAVELRKRVVDEWKLPEAEAALCSSVALQACTIRLRGGENANSRGYEKRKEERQAASKKKKEEGASMAD